MNGKAPQTILTDQNMCLKEAITVEMPRRKHALCIWLIVAKFPSWFNAILGERYNEWKTEFYRLYNLETVEEFERGWRDMLHSFGLHSNRHISNLWALRTMWAFAILEKPFLCGDDYNHAIKINQCFHPKVLECTDTACTFCGTGTSLLHHFTFVFFCHVANC